MADTPWTDAGREAAPQLTESQTRAMRRTAVIGTTDGNWQIDRVSRDVVELLAPATGGVIGVRLHTLVHPDDLVVLLAAAANAVSGGELSLRVRSGDGSWKVCHAVFSPLHEAPGFAFSLIPIEPEARTGAHAPDSGQTVRDLVVSSGAGGTSAGASERSQRGMLPLLDKLTGREREIVIRLASGKRVPAIAAELFLAKGTVRNHLSAVYRKVGVHSQQELVDLFSILPGAIADP